LTVLCVESAEEGVGGITVASEGAAPPTVDEVLRLGEDDIIDTVDAVDVIDLSMELLPSHAETELPVYNNTNL
jgi:hypothetical protein